MISRPVDRYNIQNFDKFGPPLTNVAHAVWLYYSSSYIINPVCLPYQVLCLMYAQTIKSDVLSLTYTQSKVMCCFEEGLVPFCSLP